MARGLVVSLSGEESSFQITKVERDKLYGRKERIVVDESGASCSSAYLTADGVALVPQGGTAFVYADDKFNTVERSELKAVNDAGEALQPIPSTLGVSQALQGPVPPTRLLDHIILSVYELTAEAIGEELRKALATGHIYETTFNYREDYSAETAFILQSEQGIFALIGSPVAFDYVRKEQLPEADVSSEEDAEEELDFSMM